MTRLHVRARVRVRPPARLARALLVTSLSAAAALPAAGQARQGTDSTHTDSLGAARRLEGLTVTAIRAGGTAPIAQKTIEAPAIERAFFGQDVPLLLQGEPSVTAHTETGTYWGYSYIRLRGIDQSRLNLSLDGIPLNDPEDQVLYFADFPDLANSLQSVQVQRGVGTSGTGSAAFAGSINFETTSLATRRQGGELQLGVGSFGTRRASLEYHTGLLPSRFAAYGRLSALETDGYRHASDVMGRSAFLSVGYFGDRDIVKLTATGGLMRDTMAYYAASEEELRDDRRVNPLTPRAGDQFGERIVALSYTRLLGGESSVSTTLYRTAASGRYDVYYDPTMLVDQHLDFTWYGLTSAWNWRRDGVRLDVGVNANTYARDHYARLRADRSQLYFNTGHKRDASAFAKGSWEVGRLTMFGDLQGRWAEFRYTPDEAAGIAGPSVDWTFLNPKVGATWRVAPGVESYASFGINGREPTRNDMFGGADDLDAATAAFIGPLTRVRPERVRDLEAGLRLQRARFSGQANLFLMEFRNEIAPIGAISDLGSQLRKNVGRSHRRGVELDGRWRPVSRVTVDGALTLMHARIAEYTEDATGATYQDVAPLLSPAVLATHGVTVEASRSLSVGVGARYTGRSYLANTGERDFMLPASYLVDGHMSWARGRWGIVLHANNLLNADAYGSGYTDGSTSYYFVAPPRNVLLTAKMAY